MRVLRYKVGGRAPDYRTLALRSTEGQQLASILALALLQALIYVWIVPPWQHYDEPTHFEYAWLIAHLRRQPLPGDEDAAMRREVQASMAAHGYFDPHPSLIEDDASRIWIGYSELGHPPGYYALAAIPLALLPELDVTSQLYLARMVSVALFLGTVAIAWGIARELTQPGAVLRWVVPLFVASLPTFVDLMTAVNNDVGAVFLLSLLLWGSLQLILRGFTWLRLCWVISAALLGIMIKNTAMYGLLFAPVAVIFALWARKGWPLWRLLAGLGGLALLLLLALFGWGDAAEWYRADTERTQASATLLETDLAVYGERAFVVEAGGPEPERRLLFPLREADVVANAGRTVTFGAWVWADRAVKLAPLELDIAVERAATFQRYSLPAAVTTEPSFVAYSIDLPSDARRAQAALVAATAGPGNMPLRVFFDGVVLVRGSFDAAEPPTFEDFRAHEGIWHGHRFRNLLNNGSAEQSWLRPRAWLDDRIRAFFRHRPSEVIQSALEIDRTGATLIGWAAPMTVDGLVERFGWSQVRLQSYVWVWIWRLALMVAFAGCVWWLSTNLRRLSPTRRAALAFLALVGLGVWTVTILRPLPALGPVINAPVTRYAFPAIIPSAIVLVGGWLAPWRNRRAAGFVVLAVTLALEAASIASIRAFYLAG